MNPCRWLLLGTLLLVGARPAAAGILFNRHPKANPADRIPSLIIVLRTSPDERKRTAAAEELRQFDTAGYPEVVPTLIDILQKDPSSSVRSEAVQTLGKSRPVSQQAGQALEQVQARDPSMRVRLQARTTLWQYHLSGYRSSGQDSAGGMNVKTEEPPLAPPLAAGKQPPPIPERPTTIAEYPRRQPAWQGAPTAKPRPSTNLRPSVPNEPPLLEPAPSPAPSRAPSEGPDLPTP